MDLLTGTRITGTVELAANGVLALEEATEEHARTHTETGR
jgi:beta-galactosidase